MNKGLQALKRLQGEGRVGVYDVIDITQDLEIAEYYLQALDIVKEKNVNVRAFRKVLLMKQNDDVKLRAYNSQNHRDEDDLTQEEYQHLKEVFGND